jgi:hypothetical protein
MVVGAPLYGPGPLAAGLAFMLGVSLLLYLARCRLQAGSPAADRIA